MNERDRFVTRCTPRWRELETSLLGTRALSRVAPSQASHIAGLYRSLCSDAMRARALGCGPDVVRYLDRLVARTHNLLYEPAPYRTGAPWRLVARDLPRAVRANWRWFLLASALFYLPLLFGLHLTLVTPEFAAAIVPRSTLAEMASAYRSGFAAGRDGSADAAMAGFYVHNNVGIAFRCFATGALFGLGPLYFLISNGLVIGAVMGHVTNTGGGWNILTFVCGHGPFELTAIVVSGTAGLRLGDALVAQLGGASDALRAAAPEVTTLVLGAAAMLLVAAGLEAFWSPSAVIDPVKWGFSATVSLALVAYFALAGRGGAA